MTNKRTGWFQIVRAQWSYFSALGAAFLFTSYALAGFVTWQNGAQSIFEYVLAFMDPSLGAVAFLALSALVPSLTMGKQFSLIHAATLPTVYLALVVVLKSALGNTFDSLQRFEELERFDLMWTNAKFVLGVWLALFLVMLTCLAFRSRGESSEKP